MKTIPAALAWEFLHRGRWWIPAAILGAVVPPLLLFGLLQKQGAFQPSDPQMIMVQFIMMQVGMLTVGAAVFSSLGPHRRLFTMPISAPGIVLTQLVPAGVTAAALWALSTLILNSLLPLGWPVAGPSLFIGVALPAIIATFWWSEKSFWMIPSIAAVGVVLGYWFKWRFGPVVGPSTHLWTEVTGPEFVFLLGTFITACLVGVVGIARQRREEPLPSLHLQRRLEQLLDRAPARTRGFDSPEQAQLWAEQRRKGWILPFVGLSASFVAFVIWLFVDRSQVTLLQGITGSGVTIAVLAGLIGAFGFSHGAAQSNWSIGPFLGTRPITSDGLARSMMSAQFRSVALTMTIWLIAFLIAVTVNEPHNRPPHSGWLALLMMVCAWISASVGSTVALTGRAQQFGAAFVTGLFGLYSFAIVVQLAAPNGMRREIINIGVQGVIVVLSSVIILGTIGAFAWAKRRGMVTSGMVWMATGVAAVLGICATWGLMQTSLPAAVGLLIAAGIALAVAPWATAPLAVAWNRSR